MNRILKSLVGGLVLSAAVVSAPAYAEMKVGVINYQRLMAESPQAKVALEAIQAEFRPREADLQRTQGLLKGKEEKLQKDAATMSEAQRTAAEKELRDGARDFTRKQQEIQDDFNARRNEEMTKLQRVLVEEVQAYSKAQNFDLVLADGVIYFANTLDITPAILNGLTSRKAPAASAPAPAKPAK